MVGVLQSQVEEGSASALASLARSWTMQPQDDAAQGRVVTFDSFERFAALVTRERRRILRHLHDSPEISVSALADALGRPFPLVHEDAMVLELNGLI